MVESQYHKEVLKSLEARCRQLNIPFEASESDTAVRLFNRLTKAEQALASRKAAEAAAESAKTAKASVWAARIAAACAIASLIILIITTWG
ncbi:MAG: hypothetical protein KAT11_03600 [Phycisphaerae bacterium]|nr:hypothetical protein [Phycisphaerae bacterium]